jgi:hypothetical protein
MHRPTEMVVYLSGVEIYRATPTAFKLEINGNPFYEFTKEQAEEMTEESNGNNLWKTIVGKLGYQRYNGYYR